MNAEADNNYESICRYESSYYLIIKRNTKLSKLKYFIDLNNRSQQMYIIIKF